MGENSYSSIDLGPRATRFQYWLGKGMSILKESLSDYSWRSLVSSREPYFCDFGTFINIIILIVIDVVNFLIHDVILIIIHHDVILITPRARACTARISRDKYYVVCCLHQNFEIALNTHFYSYISIAGSFFLNLMNAYMA